MIVRKVSEAVIRRLPKYYRQLIAIRILRAENIHGYGSLTAFGGNGNGFAPLRRCLLHGFGSFKVGVRCIKEHKIFCRCTVFRLHTVKIGDFRCLRRNGKAKQRQQQN